METRIEVKGKIDVAPEVKQLISDLAEEIPVQFRKAVDEQTPAGRVYVLGVQTARRTKALENLGFRNRGKTRSAVGAQIHRASAPGQFPAKRSGRLYQDIRISGSGLKKTVRFNAPHAGHVENIRPFLDEIVARAIAEVTK